MHEWWLHYLLVESERDNNLKYNAQCGKLKNSLSTEFFRQINYLVILIILLLVKTSFSQIFFSKKCESTVWKNEKFSLTEKKISSNQLFSDFFSKTIAFTKFLRKKCEREFLQFPHCECVRVNFRNFQTACVLCIHSVELTKFLYHLRIIS